MTTLGQKSDGSASQFMKRKFQVKGECKQPTGLNKCCWTWENLFGSA